MHASKVRRCAAEPRTAHPTRPIGQTCALQPDDGVDALHILTKIFVVLTALLTVALVPLVMLNTANDDTFKRRWLDEQARVKDAVFQKDAAVRLQDSETRAAMNTASDFRARLERIQVERDTSLTEVARISSQSAGTQRQLDRLTSNLTVLTESNKVKDDLVVSITNEMNSLRTNLASSQRDNIRLDEQVATINSENEVIKAERRQLQEELKQVRTDKEQAQSKLSQFVAVVGELPSARPGATRDPVAKVPADRSLSASIISVRRGADHTLAEINAGSRDGVQPGWSMTIADGSKFIGNLRITTFDVNRSVGVVELEDTAARGEVKAGLRVIARKGE